MRHLLSGVALAALLAAGLPAAAQTNGTPQPKTPPASSDQNTSVTPNKPRAGGQAGMSSSEGQSGTSQPADATGGPATKAKSKHAHAGKDKKMASAHRRGGSAPGDNMAEELNRQELAKVQQGSSPPPSAGSSAMPAQSAPDNGMAPKQ